METLNPYNLASNNRLENDPVPTINVTHTLTNLPAKNK